MQAKGIEDILYEIYMMLPYVEGVIRVKDLNRREAVKLVQKSSAQVTGANVSELLKTVDSRQLFKDIIKLIVPYCANKIVQDRILAMTPYSNSEELKKRIHFLSEMFSILEKNGELVESVKESLRSVKIGEVKPILNPMIVVSNEEMVQSISKLSQGLKVKIGKKNEVREIAKDELMTITIGMNETKECISLPESFKLYELVPDRFAGIFESFKDILEAYCAISNRFKQMEVQANMLLNYSDESEKILELVKSVKIAKLDIRSSLEEAETEVNEGIKKMMQSHGTAQEFKYLVSDILDNLNAKTGLGKKGVSLLLKDTLDNAVIPFSFSSSVIKSISESMRKRSAQDSYETYLKVSSELEQYLDVLGKIGVQLFELGLIVSLYEFSKAYDLNFCEVVDEGVGFIGSRNIFLVQEQIKGNIKIQSVDYSLGKTSSEIFGAKTSSVVLLTGANSGGKTTLLMTIAQIAIMNLLGLPVPAKKAEVLVAGIYLFRRRTVRKLGSLEHALKSMTPILTRRGKKLILMDEFEALTEPKAIARIIAAFMNNLRKQSLALFVTHLAVDIIPHINVDYRIDGIEATGVDGEGNLIVNRQPTFNKLGTSSPELIVEKLKKTTKNKRASKAYDEMLKLLRNVKVERNIAQK